MASNPSKEVTEVIECAEVNAGKFLAREKCGGIKIACWLSDVICHDLILTFDLVNYIEISEFKESYNAKIRVYEISYLTFLLDFDISGTVAVQPGNIGVYTCATCWQLLRSFVRKIPGKLTAVLQSSAGERKQLIV